MLATNPYSTVQQPAQVRAALATRFRALRKAAGHTQAEMAERTGVSLGSLRRFETSGRVSLENLVLLSWGVERMGDFNKLFERDEAMARAQARYRQRMGQ